MRAFDAIAKYEISFATGAGTHNLHDFFEDRVPRGARYIDGRVDFFRCNRMQVLERKVTKGFWTVGIGCFGGRGRTGDASSTFSKCRSR